MDHPDFEEAEGPSSKLGPELIVPVACGCVVVFYGPKEMLLEVVEWHESYCDRPKPRPC